MDWRLKLPERALAEDEPESNEDVIDSLAIYVFCWDPFKQAICELEEGLLVFDAESLECGVCGCVEGILDRL